MSARVTKASERRMEVRGFFIDLTPGYLTIEHRVSGLPGLDIRIRGLPEERDEAERVVEAIVHAYKYDINMEVVIRKTA